MSFEEKVQIGPHLLCRGDARLVCKSLSDIDALITDPVWPNCPSGLLAGSEDPYGLWLEFLDVCPAVKRASVVMRHDSDPRFLAHMNGLPYARATILPYVMPGYIGRYLGSDEIAYCFGEPIPRRAGQYVIPGRAPSVQPDGRKANGHPCSRALGHFKFLVRWWSEPGEVVMDPFAGSGTTGVAAALLGRHFVGVEVDKKHFDGMCERISKALDQGDLFIGQAPESAPQEALL